MLLPPNLSCHLSSGIMKIYEIWMTRPAGPPNAVWERDWKNPDAHAHHHRPRSPQTPILVPYPAPPPRCLLPCRPTPSATSMKASLWTLPMLPLQHKHKRRLPHSCWKAQQSRGACTMLHSRGCVEIELMRLVIRSLLVLYLSFSSTLMLSSMHHIDTHIF